MSLSRAIPLDPLGESEDPDRYVPLDTSERALAELTVALFERRSPALLVGPSGMGKTLLLHVIAAREADWSRRVRLVRSLQRSPEELATWLFQSVVGRSLGGLDADPESALLAELRALGVRGSHVLVLVDGIERTPRETVRRLGEIARAGRPEMSVVVAGCEGPELRERLRDLEPEVTIELPEAFADEEIARLYETIAADPGLSPRLAERLAHVEPEEIVRAAAGSPLRLKQELMRREADARLAPRSAPSRAIAQPVRAPEPVPIVTSPPSVGDPIPTRPARRPGRAIGRAVRATGAMFLNIATSPVRGARHVGRAFGRAFGATHAAFARAMRATGVLLLHIATSPVRGARRASRAISVGLQRVHAAVTRAARTTGSLLLRIATAPVRGARRAGHAISRGLQRIHAAVTRAARTTGSLLLHIATAPVRGARRLGRSISSALQWVGERTRAALVATTRAIRATSALLLRIATSPVRGARRIGDSISRAARGLVQGASHQLSRAMKATVHIATSSAQRVSSGLREFGHHAGLAARRSSHLVSESSARAARSIPRALERVRPVAGRAVGFAAIPLVALGLVFLASQEPLVASSPPPIAAVGAAPVVHVQVNARPWAIVRINGRSFGSTPFSEALAPGFYEVEADFPNGQTLRRQIEVTPERRFISLP